MLAIDPDGATGSASATGRAAAAFHLSGWDAPWLTGLELRTGEGQANTRLDGVFSQSTVFATTVGQTVHLVGDLSLNVNHRSSPQARDWGSAYTNGSAVYRVDVLTAGADVTTASGFSYATPVPEPGAWALMLAGLCAVGPWARRRRA
ncbi:PEP-CTERM sorting domain-containing protein [Rubrivivax albus]|uniref:PEP-CTERM sorting domain-containing protein n=2 Tax=Rubrivivax albus TaxID=2499835 RepID=A0A437K276_9BURK|nr:PEP-CTERM sorting domain-containing protein [Rubrivivax albus]